MNLIYLGALLLSIVGVGAIDRSFRLALWASPRQAVPTLLAGVTIFVAWDIAGLQIEAFFRGDSPYMTGWMLAPEFPLEELFFLLLLCYCALVAWRGADRWLAARRKAS